MILIDAITFALKWHRIASDVLRITTTYNFYKPNEY